MAEEFIDELVRYIRFEPEHQATLREFYQVAAPHFERMADEFYERIQEHDGAHRVFQHPNQVERLKLSLRAWFGRVLQGPWDHSYVERSARIGRIHVRVGLAQRYMLTAMNHIRDMFCTVVQEDCADPAKERLLRTAIDKILDTELAIMLESYREDSMAALKRAEQVEREALAERLSTTEARYRAMLEAAEVVVIAAEPSGNILLFNRKAESITGLSRLDVTSLDLIYARLPDEDAGQLERAVSQAIADRKPSSLATRIFSMAGNEYWIRWYFTVISAGTRTDVCMFGIDETDEHRLGEKTRHAERMAALGTMAAGLAHEIRNPLNAAHLQTLLIERRLASKVDDAGEGARECARVVRHELERLATLVGEFLDFARPPRLQVSVGDLSKTVEDVAHLLQPDFEACGVELRCNASEVVAARFDDEKIRQVLLNLLRNALEAAGEGGDVKVQALRDYNRAILEVSDSGAGPPDEVDLFQPFETSKEGGTGLGLSIVHRICADHGGAVAFERASGRTIFRVELPLDGIDDTATDMVIVKRRKRDYDVSEGESA